MTMLDGLFGKIDKVGIFIMDDHVNLLDYKNGTFKTFKDLEEVRAYAEHIIRIVKEMEEP